MRNRLALRGDVPIILFVGFLIFITTTTAAAAATASAAAATTNTTTAAATTATTDGRLISLGMTGFSGGGAFASSAHLLFVCSADSDLPRLLAHRVGNPLVQIALERTCSGDGQLHVAFGIDDDEGELARCLMRILGQLSMQSLQEIGRFCLSVRISTQLCAHSKSYKTQ